MSEFEKLGENRKRSRALLRGAAAMLISSLVAATLSPAQAADGWTIKWAKPAPATKEEAPAESATVDVAPAPAAGASAAPKAPRAETTTPNEAASPQEPLAAAPESDGETATPKRILLPSISSYHPKTTVAEALKALKDLKVEPADGPDQEKTPTSSVKLKKTPGAPPPAAWDVAAAHEKGEHPVDSSESRSSRNWLSRLFFGGSKEKTESPMAPNSPPGAQKEPAPPPKPTAWVGATTPPRKLPTAAPPKPIEPPAPNLTVGAEYRSIALEAKGSGSSRAMTPNTWLLASQTFAEGGSETIEPTPEPVGEARETFETYSDAEAYGPFWTRPLQWQPIPLGLLWTVPLANQREPRTYAKFTNLNNQSTIDTAIGGQFGLIRLAPAETNLQGVQLDGFATVFSRFDGARRLVSNDFRAGLPLTYAKGAWQAKAGYEHTSSHLGDDFINSTGATPIYYARDEIVIGLARWCWEQVRLYGQAGFAVHTSPIIGNKRDRFDWGVEWTRHVATTWKGQPFAALDMDLRGDQNYTANTTVQLGWQWQNKYFWSGRIAAEYYNGRSPVGQFFLAREDWYGGAFLFDW